MFLDCCEIDFFVGFEECYGGDVDTVGEGISVGSVGHFGGDGFSLLVSLVLVSCSYSFEVFIPNITGGGMRRINIGGSTAI